MITRLGRLAASLLLFAASANAQQQPEDPLAELLFPPDLVMKHASEIRLDEKQRKTLRDAFHTLQAKMVDAQWTMQEETEKLVLLLRARAADETAVLAQADKVMSLEREIKRTHLLMLVRVKNALTEEQQSRLKELRGSPSH